MMKATIESLRKRDMGSCKAPRVSNVPQTTLQRYVKDRHESSSEAIKTKLSRIKFFLVKQKMIWLRNVV
jgi:hypothetical protein